MHEGVPLLSKEGVRGRYFITIMSSKKFLPAIIAFLLIVGLFLLRNISVIQEARGMTVRFFSPLMHSKEYLSFRSDSEQKAHDEEYVHTLEFAVGSLREENGNLKKALAFADSRHMRLMGFPVLTYARDGGKEYLLVNIDKIVSIQEGALALTEQGVVVGKVKEITGFVAKIAVGSDPDELYDTIGVSGARILARGIGARTFDLEMLSAESPLMLNEFIGISIGSSTDPLLLAKVVHLEENNAKAFQGATAVLIARPELLREVYFMQ